MKRIVALLLAVLLAATCLAGAAATVTTKVKTNLYSEASADSKPITGLKAGATLEVEGTTKNYFKVTTSGGNQGYVLKSKVWVDDEEEYQTVRDMTGVKPSGKKTEEYTKNNVPLYIKGGGIFGIKLGMTLNEVRDVARKIEFEKTYDGKVANNAEIHELDYNAWSPDWRVRCNFWDNKLVKLGISNTTEFLPETLFGVYMDFYNEITLNEGKPNESGGNLSEDMLDGEVGIERLYEGLRQNKVYLFDTWDRSYWITCQIDNSVLDFPLFAVTITADGF